VVGVPVQSADIFPALITSPASAKRRRSSVDFQIPASAAFMRRFQRISTDLIDDAARAAFERSGVNRQNREQELATVKATLKDTEDSIERYLAAFEARTMPEALCGERIRSLGVRVVELRERRDDLETSLDADAIILPTDQQIAAVRAKLREALEHGDRPARKRLLQSVVAAI
jgi:hypothetical protein